MVHAHGEHIGIRVLQSRLPVLIVSIRPIRPIRPPAAPIRTPPLGPTFGPQPYATGADLLDTEVNCSWYTHLQSSLASIVLPSP
jgi:hypothetical protein